MTNILFIIITSLLVTSLQSQNVKVKCVNRTGFDLDSLVVQGALIGHLKNDSTSQIIKFKEIILDSGVIPVIYLNSKIESRHITLTKRPYECASSWKRVNEGYYNLYIYYRKSTDEECLLLSLSDTHK